MPKIVLFVLAGFLAWVAYNTSDKYDAAASGPLKPDTSPAANEAAKRRWAAQDRLEQTQNIKIAKWSWKKGGFDSVMLATFTVQNTNTFGVKDLKIKCEHSAPSGTVIDSNTQTIYEAVKAGATRTFKDVNMGLIHTQAKSSSCSIRDFVQT